MGFISRGKYVPLPWNADFDQFLMRQGDKTYQYSGDDLLHEIHKEAIESKYINLKMHAMIRWRLAVIIVLQLAICIALFIS